MRRIVLIQHCQSEHHVNEMSGGWTDTPLTDLGRRQAELIGLRLKRELAEDDYVLYTSDLKRAKQTADIVAKQLGLNVIEDRDLREINTGVAAGKTKEWANAHRAPQPGPGFNIDHREFTGGESWREFYHRVCQCMKKICGTEAKNIIIVTHGCALGYIVAWWMKFEIHMLATSYFSASPGSISLLLENNYDQQALRLFNDTAHLSKL